MSRKPKEEYKSNSLPGKHRWEDDKCIRCGVTRRSSALSPKLTMSRYGPGRYFYQYLIDGKWLDDRPFCITVKIKKNEVLC